MKTLLRFFKLFLGLFLALVALVTCSTFLHVMNTASTGGKSMGGDLPTKAPVSAKGPSLGPAADAGEPGDGRQVQVSDEERRREVIQEAIDGAKVGLAEMKGQPVKSRSIEDLRKIRDHLTYIPSGPALDALLEVYRPIARPLVARESKAAATALLKSGADSWADRMDTALLESGSNVEVSVRRHGTGYRARATYVLMSRALAYRLSRDGGMFDSAAQVGINKLTFENTLTGDSWTYDTDGEKGVRARFARESDAHWLLGGE